MSVRQIYKAVAFVLVGLGGFLAWEWADIFLIHPREKFLLDGFFYIPFALLSTLVPIYLGISLVFKVTQQEWLHTAQQYTAVLIYAVVVGFLVSWNINHSLMPASVWIIGNVMAIVILGGMKIWKTS